MIWESVALMTVLDIVIVVTAGISLLARHRQGPALDHLGLLAASRVLGLGILAVGLFYLVDLFVMWGLPLFIPYPRAMAFMEDLHLNYSWGLMLAVAGSVGVGTYLMQKALQRIAQLKEQIGQGQQAIAGHRHHEETLAAAQQIAHVGSWDWSVQDDTAAWSDEHYRVFGYEPGEIEPTHELFLGMVHPEDRDKVSTSIEAALEGRARHDLEFRIIRPDKSERLVHAQAEVHRDSGGRPVRMIGIVLDVTESRRAAEALRESEERMQLALRGADLGTWDWNVETGYVAYNERSAEILGYTAEELEPHAIAWEEMIHPDELPGLREALSEHWDGSADQHEMELRMRHKFGHWVWIMGRGRVVARDGLGKARRIAGTCLDITERKKAQERIYELNRTLELRVAQRTAEVSAAQAELQRVFDLSVDMICVSTLEGQFRRVNPAFGKTLGYTDEELVSRPYLEFVHPDDRQATLEVMRAKMDEGKTVDSFENRYRHKDGTYRWLRWTAQPVVEDGVAYATAKDVTQEKAAAEEIRRHRDHLTELVAESTAELRVASEQQAAAAALGEKALAGMPADEVMQEAVVVVARELGGGYSSLLEMLPDGEEMVLRAGVGWPDGSVGIVRADIGANSQAGYTLASDDPVLVEDLRTESRFTPPQMHLAQGIVSGISVIVRGPEKPFGVLGVHSEQPGTFKQQDVDFVQSIANLVGDSVALLRAGDNVKRSARALRALTARLQQVREEERTGLSRELHDVLGQALTCVNIDLGWMAQRLGDRDPAVQERVRASMDLVTEAIGSIQRISSELRPPVLDDLGLFDAIRWYVEAFAQRSGLAARVDLPEVAPDLGSEPATAVFRVVQEALTNVARHADASEVRVVLDNSSEALEVRVIDDGRGIPPDAITGELSLGLLGMKERAAPFDGVVEFRRRPDTGTEVVLTVPLGPDIASTPQ